jgi:hypothetical protein
MVDRRRMKSCESGHSEFEKNSKVLIAVSHMTQDDEYCEENGRMFNDLNIG